MLRLKIKINMKLSEIKIGQKVIVNGMIAEYKGIQKVKVQGFGKVEKRVFQGVGISMFKYFSLNEGEMPLENLGISLQTDLETKNEI